MIHPAGERDGPVIDGTTLVPLTEKLAELQVAVNRGNAVGIAGFVVTAQRGHTRMNT